MNLEETPKCAPPPYTVSEQSVSLRPTTTAQLPIIHVQPQNTVVSGNINESRRDMVTEGNATAQPIQAPLHLSNPRRPSSGRRFPTNFNLYYRPRVGIGRDYFLASTQSEPLNEITFHSLRLPSVALHPGFDKSRAIATFNHSTVLRPSQVCATWLAGGHTDVRTKHVPRMWTFTARVGQASSGTVERFE